MILLQELNRTEYPHDAAINSLIQAIKDKQNRNHNIIITIDGSELFISSKRGMEKLCRKYKIYDLLYKNHGDEIEINTHITDFQRIYFIFVSIKLLHLFKI